MRCTLQMRYIFGMRYVNSDQHLRWNIHLELCDSNISLLSDRDLLLEISQSKINPAKEKFYSRLHI